MALLPECARSGAGDATGKDVEITAVAKLAGSVAPGRVVTVALTVSNLTSSEVIVVNTSLWVSPTRPGFRFGEEVGNPERIAAGQSETFVFHATLPVELTDLVVDGTITAWNDIEQKAYQVDSAFSPWQVVPDQLSSATTDLVVTVTADTLDGGAAVTSVLDAGGSFDLSLREAAAIASNRPGPDTIAFDGTLFSEATPGRILIDQSLGAINVTGDGTVIDGTGRSVLIEGGAGTSILIEANACAVRHLEFLQGTWMIAIKNAGSPLIDACTFRGFGASTQWGVLAEGTTFLTVRNSTFFGALKPGIRILLSSDALITGNSMLDLQLTSASSCEVSDNLFPWNTSRSLTLSGSSDNLIANNRFPNSGGSCLQLTVGSDRNQVQGNVMVGCGDMGNEYPIRITGLSQDNTLSRNSIFSTLNTPIVVDAGSQRSVLPPALVSTNPTISGTSNAPAGSVIEIFHDAADQAEVYVGQTTITAPGSWSFTPAQPISSGRFVTTTVTLPGGSTSALSSPMVVP